MVKILFDLYSNITKISKIRPEVGTTLEYLLAIEQKYIIIMTDLVINFVEVDNINIYRISDIFMIFENKIRFLKSR